MILGVFSNLCGSVKPRHDFSILLQLLYPTELIGFLWEGCTYWLLLFAPQFNICVWKWEIVYLECRICLWGGSWTCLGSHTPSFLILGHWLISSCAREQQRSSLWHHDFCARKLYPKVVIGQASFLFLSFTLRRTAGGQNYSYMEDVPFIISLRTKLLLRQDIPKMF